MTKQSMSRKFDRQAKSYEKRRNRDKAFKYREKYFLCQKWIIFFTLIQLVK